MCIMCVCFMVNMYNIFILHNITNYFKRDQIQIKPQLLIDCVQYKQTCAVNRNKLAT